MSAMRLDVRGVLTACSSCGRTNRLGYARLDKTSKCGQCGAALPAVAEPVDVPSADMFDALLRESVLPVVVDFWAPWCGPCKMVAPELVKVARGAAGRLLIVKVDTDAVPDLGERYRIRSIPTMAVFHQGREVTRTTGAQPAPAIEAFVRNALQSAA